MFNSRFRLFLSKRSSGACSMRAPHLLAEGILQCDPEISSQKDNLGHHDSAIPKGVNEKLLMQEADRYLQAMW